MYIGLVLKVRPILLIPFNKTVYNTLVRRVNKYLFINMVAVGTRFTTELRSRIFGFKSNRRKTSTI